MDLNKNRIPDIVESIHLIAVCGTGMGALACMLKELGYKVTGSDGKVYPPISTFLMDKGIKIIDGFDGKNLEYRPDLVIVGNAVRKDNPEVLKMQELELNFCSMPQALNKFAAKNKKVLLVTGTHGKTTTSSLLSWILSEAGLDPSFMIGGILQNYESNYRLGKGNYIVIEGDEYDTAFFDKGSKFLHFDPFITILTSIEFDHADIFSDLEHVKKTFYSLVSKINHENRLIIFDDDENIKEVTKDAQCKKITYGKKDDSSWHLCDISVKPPWNCFKVVNNDGSSYSLKTKIVGEHNLLNALSVIAAARSLGISFETISKGLESFKGVKRRQEVRGEKKGIIVMDDFAHHPTAVKETIKAVKPFYNNGRVIAVFEPRTNSSMRKVFQDIYPLSFDEADLICIRSPSAIEKVPIEERFSSDKLVFDIKKRGKEAYLFENTEAIIEFLVKEAKCGDLLLIMSNGGFDNIHERLLKSL